MIPDIFFHSPPPPNQFTRPSNNTNIPEIATHWSKLKHHSKLHLLMNCKLFH